MELTITNGAVPREVQLLCRPRLGATEAKMYFTAMIDISERRLLEAERDAAALEQAALASRLLSIQDDERQRIARDLHDNLGQQVTALRLLLDVVAPPGTRRRAIEWSKRKRLSTRSTRNSIF